MFLQRASRVVKDGRLLERMGCQKTKAQTLHRCCKMLPRVTTASSITALSIWGFMKPKNERESVINTKEKMIELADAWFAQGKYKELYEILSECRDSKDVEVLWRLSRVLYTMAQTASDVEATNMIFEAYDLICAALKLRDDHWAVHKWYAILLNSKSNYEGLKANIRELNNIKKHLMRAVELNPSDATILYMIGTWCYQIADLSWYQRKVAAMFGEPPDSTFQEALTYFENAEKTDPNFYSHNLLMLGKTYLKLNQKQDAIKYLTMVSKYQAKNIDDLTAVQEAKKILKEIN